MCTVIICHLKLRIRKLCISRLKNIVIKCVHLELYISGIIFIVHRKIQCHNLAGITLSKMNNMSPFIRISLRLPVNGHFEFLTMTGFKIDIHILLFCKCQLPCQRAIIGCSLIKILIFTGTGQHSPCHFRLTDCHRCKQRLLCIRGQSHKIILSYKRIALYNLPLLQCRIHHITQGQILLVLIHIFIHGLFT